MRIDLALTMMLAGCGGQPSCKDVVDKVASLTNEQLSDKDRESAMKQCETWPTDTKKCVMKASSEKDLMRCAENEQRDDRPATTPRRPTEATVQLKKLQKAAKVAYVTNAEFPKGSVGLTPAKPCCAGDNRKCAANAADWAVPAWQALDFQIDEPHDFQYSYESDGKTFTAKAVGDLDCDTIMITYVLKGTVESGNPVFTLTEPPLNSD